MTIPKIAVLATGLAAAILVATINPVPAQAFPNKQQDCTNCHGVLAGARTATPSTATPAAGAAYTVAITISANASAGDTGYWIANSTAAGVTGTTTGVYGGYTGTGALTYTAAMTAPAAAGTYYYKVWSVNGGLDSARWWVCVGTGSEMSSGVVAGGGFCPASSRGALVTPSSLRLAAST